MIHEFEEVNCDETFSYEELEKVVDKELELVFENKVECNPSFYHYILASMKPGESVVLNERTHSYLISK